MYESKLQVPPNCIKIGFSLVIGLSGRSRGSIVGGGGGIAIKK